MTESERSGPRAGQEIGGTAVTPADLEAMHAGDYILRARGGELSRVPVEKIRLPRDPQNRSLHADVIINHFHRVDGKPFDRKGIHNSLLGAMSSQESSRIARQLVDVAKASE